MTAEEILEAIYRCRLDGCQNCKYLLHADRCMDELLDDAAGVILRQKAELEKGGGAR